MATNSANDGYATGKLAGNAPQPARFTTLYKGTLQAVRAVIAGEFWLTLEETAG